MAAQRKSQSSLGSLHPTLSQSRFGQWGRSGPVPTRGRRGGAVPAHAPLGSPGQKSRDPGEDPGASCLWARGHPVDGTLLRGHPVGGGLPFSRGRCPLRPGLQRGAEPSLAASGHVEGSASGSEALPRCTAKPGATESSSAPPSSSWSLVLILAGRHTVGGEGWKRAGQPGGQ